MSIYEDFVRRSLDNGMSFHDIVRAAGGKVDPTGILLSTTRRLPMWLAMNLVSEYHRQMRDRNPEDYKEADNTERENPFFSTGRRASEILLASIDRMCTAMILRLRHTGWKPSMAIQH